MKDVTTPTQDVELIVQDASNTNKSVAIIDVDKQKQERLKEVAIDNVLSTINKNQQVIDEFARFVCETDDPRAYEIFSKMMLNSATISEKLMNIVYAQNKNEEFQNQQSNQTNIQQNNYIMNPADLIKQLKSNSNN